MIKTFNNKSISIWLFTLLGVSLLLFPHSLKAIKAKGYVITADSDTVIGVVKLPKTDPITGFFILKGFDHHSLFSGVWFKGQDSDRFKLFKPDQIKEYGFNYKQADYLFQSFLMQPKSLVASERESQRFLHLIYSGCAELFEDQQMVLCESDAFNRNNGNRLLYQAESQFYILDASNRLINAKKNAPFETLAALLRHLKLDEAFINIIPKNARFDEVLSYLKKYDGWMLSTVRLIPSE